MNQLFPVQLINRIERAGVIAVLVVDDADDAVPLARALLEGGIDIMELTLRTPAALDALERIRREVPAMMAGVGTILTPGQVEEVVQKGGVFGVSPGLNPRVVRRARRLKLPFAPGVATPSDIEQAVELGCRIMKFFPSEPSGGLKYLKNMAAPYAHLGLRYIPLGGISTANVGAYLADPLILAVGGSWLAPRDLIVKKAWEQITCNARQAAAEAKNREKGRAQ